ncbi:MAG: methyltransferase domain-containing protein [Eggerthellaceae bacterium]|nr:methyltransferase domain-containing protein [Eggerthellaceae bacterium]
MSDNLACVTESNCSDVITEYWNGRAWSYSNGVNGELADTRRDAWEHVLAKVLEGVMAETAINGRMPHVADFGCGPGFFTVLLAGMGCKVDAFDASAEMLSFAKKNVAVQVPDGDVAFHECDLLSLPIDNNTFDACFSRNVTWLMQDPEAAYSEWLRVLRPGGKLVTFDANWYRYLVDSKIDAQRHADQDNNVLEGWDEDSHATPEEVDRCEKIAETLPLTPILRPQWDVDTLNGLGVAWVRSDEDAWKNLWTASEQLYYSSSPMFMVEAVK